MEIGKGGQVSSNFLVPVLLTRFAGSDAGVMPRRCISIFDVRAGAGVFATSPHSHPLESLSHSSDHPSTRNSYQPTEAFDPELADSPNRWPTRATTILSHMSIYTVQWYTASGLRIQHQSLVATPQCQCGCKRLLLRKLDDGT